MSLLDKHYTPWQTIGTTTCGRPAGLPEPGQPLKDICEKTLDVHISKDDFRVYSRKYAMPARSDDRDNYPECRRDVFVHVFALEDLRLNRSVRVEEYWTIKHQVRTLIICNPTWADVHKVKDNGMPTEDSPIRHCRLFFNDDKELVKILDENDKDITELVPLDHWIGWVDIPAVTQPPEKADEAIELSF